MLFLRNKTNIRSNVYEVRKTLIYLFQHSKTVIDVDSTDYAHQQKSFAMLEHICTRHVHQYDWFVRAVDDVYIDVPRLRALLSRYDPRRAVSHPGQGHNFLIFCISIKRRRLLIVIYNRSYLAIVHCATCRHFRFNYAMMLYFWRMKIL